MGYYVIKKLAPKIFEKAKKKAEENEMKKQEKKKEDKKKQEEWRWLQRMSILNTYVNK